MRGEIFAETADDDQEGVEADTDAQPEKRAESGSYLSKLAEKARGFKTSAMEQLSRLGNRAGSEQVVANASRQVEEATNRFQQEARPYYELSPDDFARDER